MTRNSLFLRSTYVGVVFSLACLVGCPSPSRDRGAGQAASGARSGESETAAAPDRTATAKAEDVEAAKDLVERLGSDAMCTIGPAGVMTELVVVDGAQLTPGDISLFGRLTDLKTLQMFDYRDLNDQMVAQLAGLKHLKTLALTNTVISDSAVETIVQSFPGLTDLDLSYDANITNSAMKVICRLTDLERLTLIQDRFDDLSTLSLSKLEKLKDLDLRGDMGVGDMSMEVIGALPGLVAFKHRSTTVTDLGVEYLAKSKTLRSLLIQDFLIDSMAGEELAKIANLTDLQIFRCPQFGSDGVLALKGVKLTRLKLRDLPNVDDQAMAVFEDLPELKRLELHENDSISDEGLKHLQSLKSLEILDIWAIPQMTDATVDIIAALPSLKQLSIRSTGVTDASVDKLMAMRNLEVLTLRDNAGMTPEGLKKLAGRKWAKLDVGQ